MPAPRTVKRPLTEQQRARRAYKTIPTKTVADDPKGYTKQPHAYGDLITGKKLGTALQRDIVYWIGRKTWGEPKRPEYAKLSLAMLCRLCGVAERKTVSLALRDLEQPTPDNPKGRGIIEARDRTGCGATTTKMYKLTPERWKTAPKYEAPKIEDAAEDVPEDEEEEENPIPDAAAAPERIVEPGKVSKPQPITVSTKDAPAIVVRVTYRSDLPFPVTFRARAGRNGRVQVTAGRHHNPANCSRTQPQFEDSPVDNKRFEEFDAASNRIALAVWSKEADAALVHKIMAAAGSAPVELFEHIARARVQKADAKRFGALLLVHIAADAAGTYARRQALEALEKPQPYTPMTPAELAAALAELDSQPAPPERKPICTGCKGTGKVERGIAGLFKNCGVCKGTGELPR